MVSSNMMKIKQINLIPRDLLKKSPLEQARDLFYKDKKTRNIIIISALIIFITFIQLIAVAILGLNLKVIKFRAQRAKLELNRLQSQALELEKRKNELHKEESLKKEKLEQLLSASSGDKSYSELFEFIAGLAPAELWIKRFFASEQEVEIAGTALDPQLIIQFMNQLDESGAFRNSIFSSSEKEVLDSHAVYNFQISTTPIWEALKSKT